MKKKKKETESCIPFSIQKYELSFCMILWTKHNSKNTFNGFATWKKNKDHNFLFFFCQHYIITFTVFISKVRILFVVC